MPWTYTDTNRTGDHIWWISDVRKCSRHYPDWQLTYDVPAICREIFESNVARWLSIQKQPVLEAVV